MVVCYIKEKSGFIQGIQVASEADGRSDSIEIKHREVTKDESCRPCFCAARSLRRPCLRVPEFVCTADASHPRFQRSCGSRPPQSSLPGSVPVERHLPATASTASINCAAIAHIPETRCVARKCQQRVTLLCLSRKA